MDNKKEKVVHIRNGREQAAAEQDTGTETPAASQAGGPRRDMGKAAVFISVLAVLLLVVFFYALNRNMAGLASQVEELTALRAQVTQMEDSIGSMGGEISGIQGDIVAIQDKMTVLDEVPDMARRTMIRSMLQDLSQRMAFIAEETQTPEQQAKIKAAQSLLNEARAEIGAQE